MTNNFHMLLLTYFDGFRYFTCPAFKRLTVGSVVLTHKYALQSTVISVVGGATVAGDEPYVNVNFVLTILAANGGQLFVFSASVDLRLGAASVVFNRRPHVATGT